MTITTVNNDNNRNDLSPVIPRTLPNSAPAPVALLFLEHSRPVPFWTCFLLPRLTLFLRGLLPTLPQVFVHTLPSCSGLHCPLCLQLHTSTAGVPYLLLHFIFLHSTYHHLPYSIFLFCVIFPHKRM